MKIVLVGAGVTIGRAVRAALGGRHDVLSVGHRSGDFQVDIADPDSIRRLFEQTGDFDALVSATGKAHFGPFDALTPAQFEIGLRSKLMGQVNLVMLGLPHVRDGGSFTLTSGLLNEEPIRQGTCSALVNGGLEGFVRGAAIELPRGVRLNLVSPTVIEESLPAYAPFFPGVPAVAADVAAQAYVRSVEGAHTGRVYRVGWQA